MGTTVTARSMKVFRLAVPAAAMVAGLLLTGSVGASGSPPSTATPPSHIGGTPMFTTNSWGLPGPTKAAAVATLPHWASSFSLGGKTYHYTMVGTNPTGNHATALPTEILPITLTFSSGPPLTSTTQTTALKSSPIFKPTAFTSGTTQFGDAMQRAEFWNVVSTTSTNYHVRLGKPTVLPTVTINIPAADGTEYYYSPLSTYYAYVDYTYFTTQLAAVISAANFDPKTLPLIISSNVFLYTGTTSNCCVYGYHGSYATSTTRNTYAYANFLTDGLSSTPGAGDIYTFSHEVAEWMNDPFVNNSVPRWIQPGTGTCFSSLLEVGDPVEALNPPGYSIAEGGVKWNPTDVAGLSWFTHASPSTEQNGLYSYDGKLTSSNTNC